MAKLCGLKFRHIYQCRFSETVFIHTLSLWNFWKFWQLRFSSALPKLLKDSLWTDQQDHSLGAHDCNRWVKRDQKWNLSTCLERQGGRKFSCNAGLFIWLRNWLDNYWWWSAASQGHPEVLPSLTKSVSLCLKTCHVVLLLVTKFPGIRFPHTRPRNLFKNSLTHTGICTQHKSTL